jgi:hypothetical protein
MSSPAPIMTKDYAASGSAENFADDVRGANQT